MTFRSLGTATLAVAFLAAFGGESAYAQLNTIVQTGSVNGINSGFGNIIGSGATLTLNQASPLTNIVSLSLTTGGGTLGGGFGNDTGVIYFATQNTLGSGFTSTTSFNDAADGGRAATSGRTTNGAGRGDLTFAPGFTADYALAFGNFGAALFGLASGGNGSLNFIDFQGTGSGTGFTYNLNLANIGLITGESFDYLATYGNPTDGAGFFRSNEFIGVAPGSFPANIGASPATLTTNNFNRFVSVAPAVVPEAGTIPLALSALSIIGTIVVVRRPNTK